ncbi:Conserved hypothetical protein, DUF2334 [Clostridium neonatale]|uniref:DUF2334 domain-containing protein n=1 Tax=Clostridium neonatale TaxID=137838 RepID=UPI00291BED38|nr:Conserved hypothetical protein, DUF2334 [Clostridium neonatale]CAI3585194.1 Conserved hypothetical protein, DUF2334 [Clostridium neonatale]CAI3690561.1 Conserved hypothetical protein, DUF2334 [Clostridium neonatale]CAI3730437.1 Conserved hypothetical protein, DUF2334 [Clostridium neonatale]
MKKKLKVYTLVLISFSILALFFYFNCINDIPILINNNLYSSKLPNNTFKSSYNPKILFENMPTTKVRGVSLDILSEKNITNIPMILKAQRYYIPLPYICKKLDYSITPYKNSFKLIKNNSNDVIILSRNSFTTNSKEKKLRGNLLKYNNENYISISDIEEIFNLEATFNFENQNIQLLNSTIKKIQPNPIYNKFNRPIAMIRFEDFTCGDSNFSDKNQAKVKFMADYLYENNIKFHVGWIPRFKAPSDNIDNDLLSKNNMVNVGFVNLLDYLINKNAEIGLHGYTHQHGNSRSAVGEELSKDINNNVSDTKKVVENGIDTASALNIPITFFESPHYSATELQENVINNYFQLLYEPYNDSINHLYKTKTNNLYVPTPLGYIDKPKDTKKLINALNNTNPEIFHSFFYHPSIEIRYIDFDTNNNSINIRYDENSPLKQIVQSLKENNYATIHISQLTK